jgi:UDP-N-acetylmuramoyl-tripeptide--D-alanyl-D-alanine ligase
MTTPLQPALFTLDDLLTATQATVFNRQANPFQQPFAPASISTDARQLTPGQVFIPIVGDRFDGHDFREQAYHQGAVATFMQADKRPLTNQPNQCIVPDTLRAYQQLGRWHRRRINPVVVGVTGSSGKTTTKTMLQAGLSRVLTSQCTQKNYNNDIGVTQTLLAIQPSTQLAIVEMAMRGPGEITRLTLAAEPNIALITNIGPAHIERLGSLEAIAQAKCEIVKGLHPDTGMVVANGDDALLMETLQTVWRGRIEAISLAQLTQSQPTPSGGVTATYGPHTLTLPVPGEHMLRNALMVLKVAELLNAPLPPVLEGLAAYEAETGRYSLIPLSDNTHVIQDAYNANPDSMQASISTFLLQPTPLPGQQKALVLAGMNELGPFSETYHSQLGNWLGKALDHDRDKLAWILLIGADCQPTYNALKQHKQVVWVPQVDEAEQWLTEHPMDNTLILVKGSRSYQLENLLTRQNMFNTV